MLRGDRIVLHPTPVIIDKDTSYCLDYEKISEYSPDLLIPWKIDSLYKQGQISGPVYHQLSELYEQRVDAEKDYWEAFNVGDNEQYFSDRIVAIDSIFASFGLFGTEEQEKVKIKQ